MWSLLEAFRLTSLSTLIETKSRQTAMGAGWAALRGLVSGKVAQSRLAMKLKGIALVEGLVLSKIAKDRAEMMAGISDLKFAGFFYLNDRNRRRKAMIIMQMLRTQKAKAFQVLRELGAASVKFDLQNVRRERNQLAYAMPDMDEINRNHDFEIEQTKETAKKATAIRRLEYAFLAKKRRAYHILTNKPEVESVIDPKLVQLWILNLIALRQREKTFRAMQILRFPTLARHERQKAAEKMRAVLESRVDRTSRVALNRLCKGFNKFSGRYQLFFDALHNKVLQNSRKSFYSILAQAKGASGDSADRLAVVAWMANRINCFQKNYDQRFKRPCLTKLVGLLDLGTQSRVSLQDEAQDFELLIEKRLRLEREEHPKILAKLNCKAEAAEIRRKIADLKLDISILTKNMENHRESTRKLQPMRENEVWNLVVRRNLGFSYETELRRMLGDMWGPSKMHQGEQHSLSHAVEAGEQTNRTLIMDQEVSKNVELDADNLSPMVSTQYGLGRKAVESEYQPTPEALRSNVMSKTNHSEKLLRDIESKKLIKRLKEMSLDTLMDQQGPALEEILGQLVTTKAELETALERLVSDANEVQRRGADDAERVKLLGNQAEEVARNKVRFEMRLIDFQDRKGNLVLAKTTTSHRNDEIRTKINELQGQISDLQGMPSSDATTSLKLEKMRSEYFEKAELAQQNSSEILKLDQELQEVNRSITGMSEQAASFKTELRELEEAKRDSEERLALSSRRMNELRTDIRELISQISMNVTLIESLELRKRRIGSSTGEQSSDRSALELFARFKEGFLRLNGLRLQKAKLLSQQCEMAREIEDYPGEISLVQRNKNATSLSGLGDQISGDPSDTKVFQKKQPKTNQNRMTRRLSALSSEVQEIKRCIENESEKLKDFMEDHDEPSHKVSGSLGPMDNRTDFLSKNSAYLSTRCDFGATEIIENSTVRENLLNLSKSSLADDNVKVLLVSRLNPEAREAFAITEQTPLGTAAFDEALAAVIAKKNAYLQNNQLTFFSFLKKEEIENRIRGNSCEILDAKERMAACEIAIRRLLLRLRGLGFKMTDAQSAIGRRRPQGISQSVGESLGFHPPLDTPDVLQPRKKGVGINLDGIFETKLFPKRRERAICKLDPLITKKKVNLNNYLDIDPKDLFDGKPEELLTSEALKFDLNESGIKDSLVLDEFFPTEGMKKSVRKMYVKRQLESYLTPSPGDNVQSIHDTNRKSSLVEPLARPPRRVKEISHGAKILVNANYENQKIKAVHLLAKRIPSAIRNATNLNFYHLKLVASNTRLQQMMAALSRFRLSALHDRLSDVQGKFSSQSASALAEAIQAAVLNRQRHGFQRMRAKANEANRYRNWLLSKWMAKGDANMRKHMRLTVQYWRHIRNDNLWNAKILKTMAVKAPLTAQIALWRIMLFKRRPYTCPPKVVHGLLNLIRVAETAQLKHGLLAIQGQERPGNDFNAKLTPDKQRQDPLLLQSEMVTKESVNEDFGIKSQRLYSLFTYMGIIQKRAKLLVFYKFLEQVKAEPVQRKLLRFEPKGLEPTNQADSGVRAVKFLLDQLGRSRNELASKTVQVQDLQNELDGKNENLLFMQVFLLNMALRRTERAMHRVFARNATLAAFQFIEALKSPKTPKARAL